MSVNTKSDNNWERIAALAGFSEDPDKNPSIRIDINEERSEPLLAPHELDETEPISRMSFVNNPNQKTFLLVGGAVAILASVGVTMAGFPPRQSAQQLEEKKETQQAHSSESSTPNSEVGQLKTELALSKQSQQLAKFKEHSQTTATPPKNSLNPPKKTQPTSKPTSTRVRETNDERVTLGRSPRRQSANVIRPVSATTRRVETSPLPPGRQQQPESSQQEETIDPMQAWEQAAALGSYGRVAFEEVESTPSEELGREAYQTVAYHSDDSPSPNRSKVQQRTKSSYKSVSRTPLNAINEDLSDSSMEEDLSSDWEETNWNGVDTGDRNNASDDELPVLQGRPLSVKRIDVGTTVKSELMDSIVWDDEQLYSDDYSTVRLTEPLRDSEGEIILPEGTLLVIRVLPSPSGIVSISAELALIGYGEDLQEIPLEKGSLIFRTSDQKPLVAERVDPESDGDDDIGGLIIDALGTAASFALNDENSYRQLHQFNSVRDFYDRHFEEDRRQNRYYSRERSSVWMLEAGMEVEVYVNRPITIRE
jgi:hypothetical protein